MNELNVFSYGEKEVRTVQKDGETWWVAKDVCEVFGETNYRRSIQSIDEDEKGVSQMYTPGGNQDMTVVNEVGLYSLLFAMQPTKARGVSEDYISEREEKLKKFKRWVTHEVLPSIRKYGMYAADELLNNPDFLLQVATTLKEERDRNKKLAEDNSRMRPKEIFADAVCASHTSILIGELSKILRQNGVEIGQNRLFGWLRDNGYLIRRGGTDWNMPTQRSMEMELFRIKERTISNPDGSVRITKTVLATGKGQQYFVNKFLGLGAGNGRKRMLNSSEWVREG